MGNLARTITIFPQARLPEPLPVAIHPKMLFRDAGPLWLQSRKLYIARSTYRDYEVYLRTLSDFFGQIALENIDGNHVREYQIFRSRACGASAINHETSVLQQILKRVDCWREIADFQPLPLA